MLIKASDLASQIAVSNSPYDRSISSFRVSQLQGLGSPFSVTLPPSLSVPRDPWLQLPLLYVIPPFWHREGAPRVAPDHNPPQPVLTWVMPKTTYRPGSPTREDFWEQQKTVWSIKVPWESKFLLKLPIRNWLNNLKKNTCSSVNTRQIIAIWKGASAQTQAEIKHLYSKRQYTVYSIQQAKNDSLMSYVCKKQIS